MKIFTQNDFTQNVLEEAEALMSRNQRAAKFSDLTGTDSEIWIDISQELHDALECYPEELSEVTKARIERWCIWVESLEGDRTEELISEHQAEQTLDDFREMDEDDLKAYYLKNDQEV